MANTIHKLAPGGFYQINASGTKNHIVAGTTELFPKLFNSSVEIQGQLRITGSLQSFSVNSDGAPSGSMNAMQINHKGVNGDNGLMLVNYSPKAQVLSGAVLGGIGFDSYGPYTDTHLSYPQYFGQVPSNISESSAYIMTIASEDHNSQNKGGHLIFGTSPTNQDHNLAGIERMRIEANGDVGIGTTNPTELLHVFQPTNNQVVAKFEVSNSADYIFRGNSTSGYATTFNMDNTGLDIQTSGHRAITLKTNSTDRVTIDGLSGSVGIATTSPDYRLDIEGPYDNTGTDYICRMWNKSTSTTGTSNILNLRHSQEDSSYDFNNGERWISFTDADGSLLGYIHSDVTYGSFTGEHPSQRPSGSSFNSWKQGMIVKSTGTMVSSASISRALPEVELTTTQKDKAVFGVFSFTGSAGHDIYELDNTLPCIHVNALGEGSLLVTDTNGDIEVGDYICSSTRLGHGEKQDDDLMHNYTVAKATQPYTFASASIDSDLGYKSAMIGCTYHCG